VGRGAVRARHELSGPFPADAHLADVRPVGSGGRGRRRDPRPRRRADPALPRGTTGRSPSPGRPRCATRILPSSSFPAWASSASARTSARRGSRPSSSSTRST
jgi:hypothetical protein